MNKEKNYLYYVKNEKENFLYRKYRHIRKRTMIKTHSQYFDYGGRGIKLKFKNLEDFVDYVTSLTNFELAEKNNLQLDRIDNDKSYEKGNLRWVSNRENSSNRRTSNEYVGVYYHKTLKKYVAQIRINKKRVYLGKFADPKEARIAYLKKLLELKESELYKESIIEEIETLERILKNDTRDNQ